MKKVSIRIADREDSKRIAAELRAADVAEVSALGSRPYGAVESSRLASDIAWVAFVDGKPAMMFGVCQPLTAEEAEVWALGTDVCTGVPREMLWYGRKIVRGLLKRYPVMVNVCDARYAAAHRWLKRIGFTVGTPEPVGPDGELFCRIRIEEGRICA